MAILERGLRNHVRCGFWDLIPEWHSHCPIWTLWAMPAMHAWDIHCQNPVNEGLFARSSCTDVAITTLNFQSAGSKLARLDKLAELRQGWQGMPPKTSRDKRTHMPRARNASQEDKRGNFPYIDVALASFVQGILDQTQTSDPHRGFKNS